MNKDPHSFIRLLTIIFFLGMLSTPGIITVFDSENKFIPPADTTKKYTVEFENYFNNNFGARKELITAFYFVRMKLLRETYIDDKIIAGKNNWLLYDSKADGMGFEDAAGKLHFQPDELTKVKNNLEEQLGWLERKGIKYLLVICPNKHTIYPESLPASFVRGATSLDQLSHYLKTSCRVPFIDLREGISKGKEEYSQPLYYKTDTHWNQLGAFLAYREIIKNKSFGIEAGAPRVFTDFDVKAFPAGGKDITAMIGLKDYYTDTEIKFSAPHGSNKISAKKILIFNDSYYNKMRPFFEAHFSSVAERPFFWSSFDYKFIEETKPDLVIYELVERYQRQLLRDNPEEIKK